MNSAPKPIKECDRDRLTIDVAKIAVEGMVKLEAMFKTIEAERDALKTERDAYKKAKQENDERFMRERDEAREELDNKRGAMMLEIHRLSKENTKLREALEKISKRTLDTWSEAIAKIALSKNK